jgi:hypothetical protein
MQSLPLGEHINIKLYLHKEAQQLPLLSHLYF